MEKNDLRNSNSIFYIRTWNGILSIKTYLCYLKYSNIKVCAGILFGEVEVILSLKIYFL